MLMVLGLTIKLRSKIGQSKGRSEGR